MKKQLLCSSAIAFGVAAAAPASAAEWNLDWGGFFNAHVAIGDISGSAIPAGVDPDGDSLDLLQNTEIIFTPSITLDNGIKFGINIQMEGSNGGGGIDGIDESYMTISGSFGQFDIGSENSAGYKSMVAGPSTTALFINSPSISSFVPFSLVHAGSFRQAGLSSYTEVAGNNDINRITYYTPSFSGLTVGVSYAPSAGVNAQSGFNGDRNTVVSDIFDIGVNYGGSFGGADVSFGARWGTGNAPTGAGGDPETWGIGAQGGFSGFSIGGSYAENDNGGVAGAGDQSGWSAGVQYDIPGPWTVGFEAYLGEADLGAAGDTEYSAYQLGARRNLGPGVNWDLSLTFVEAEDATGTLDVEGTVIGTSINLSF